MTLKYKKTKAWSNPNQKKVDRDALHTLLQNRANSQGRVTVHHGRLAEDLDIRRDHMGRIFREFIDAGRIRHVRKSNDGVVYSVMPLEDWQAEQYKKLLIKKSK